MRMVFILFCIVALLGCYKKYPMKIDMSSYRKGLEISDSDTNNIDLFDSNVCVVLDPVVGGVRELKDEGGKDPIYKIDVNDLLKEYNLDKDCDRVPEIRIKDIKFEYGWDGMMRLNRYKIKLDMESSYECNNDTLFFVSTKDRWLEKNGKIIGLGLINEQNTQALVAATLVLAFDDAISEVSRQIRARCQE